jgi:hypothetical protein
MAKTATEVELKRPASTNRPSLRNTAPAVEEQSRQGTGITGSWLWFVTPVVLLATAGAVFLAARRWLDSDENDSRLI